MNKRIVFLIGFLALVLSACAPTPPPTQVPPTSAPAAFPLTITDDAGRAVTIKAEPKRVVSLAPSNTETIYALGKGATVVGVTEYCNFPPEAKEKPKVGGFAKIDLEKVVGLSPDLVLATNIHAKSIVPELEKRGLTVVVMDPKNMTEVIGKLTTFGKMLGANEDAGKLAAQLKSRMDAIISQVATAKTKPRVFYEIDKSLYTPGPGSFIDDMLVQAGGVNIAAAAKGNFVQLSVETIIAQDPEVIFLGDMNFGETPEKIKVRPGWANITAVKTGRIVPLPNEDVISRPGPRIVEGFEMLARGLYPDLFK
ncbi:MAG: ABC transporter substrate-binding protein [Chloroflexi bacterium]|nr:ABC transporter substrate-binding protein [Chloroflexota bacterium]